MAAKWAKLSLKEYCLARKPSDSPAGDIAFDIRHDDKFPAVYSKVEAFAYFSRVGASYAFVEAFDKLWREYERKVKVK